MKKICILVALCATISAFSQVEDTTKTNQLQEVELQVQRYAKTKHNNTNQIETITQKEVEFGNYQTTADMLSNSGTLFVQKSQQGGGSPVIRGLEANRILLLVDGIRMNNLIFRAGHLQNSITIDENMLESTDILSGSSSTPFGSDALGGAINFITKKPLVLSENANKPFSGTVSGRYGSVNEEKSGYGDFRFSGAKWGSLTSFSYNDFGDLKMGSKKNRNNSFFGERPYYIETNNGTDTMVKNDNPLVQKFTAYKQYNALQKFVFKPNATSEHNLNLQFSTTSDIPRYDRLTDVKSNGDLKTATWNYGPQKRILAAYKFNKEKAILNSDLSLGASYQNVEESRITRSYQNPTETSRIEKVAVYAINADLKAKIGNGSLVYGAEAYYDNLNSSAFNTNISTGATSQASTRYPDGKNFTLRTDAFVTYFSNPNARTTYNFGARAGYVKLHSDFITNSLNLPYTEINQKNITYSAAAGIVNNSTENVKIGFNISSGFRVPNIDDLAKIFESAPGKLIVPNAQLKPEKNITGEVNLTLFDKKTYEFVNTVYYTQLFDAIVTDVFVYNGATSILYEGVNSTILANQNLGKASIFGFSSTAKVNLIKNVKGYGSYHFTYGRIEGNSANKGMPLDHIPPHYGKLGFNFENKRFQFDLNMLYNGKKGIDEYFLNGEDNEQYAPKNGMPAWQTYNFKGAVKVLSGLTFFMGIENIFDIQYRTFASGMNAPGRNIYGGAKYSF